jgi:hypothetical protein
MDWCLYWFFHWHGYGRSRRQGLIEYALSIALVAFMVIGTLALLDPQIAALFPRIQNAL